MTRLIFILLSIGFSAPAFAVCGDTVTDPAEQCDDGNTIDGDGCNALCFVECGALQTNLINGGFEFPLQAAGTETEYDESAVPAWFTTADNNLIQLFGSDPSGVSSVEGRNFASLNVDGRTNVYQYIDVVPGVRIDWSLWHRAERDRNEKIRIMIGTSGADLVRQKSSTVRLVWTEVSERYTVPQGVYRIRFQIEARNPKNSDQGNFIDNVNFDYPDIDLSAQTNCNISPNVIYSQNGPGRIQIAANGVLSCDPSDPDCAGARNFTGTKFDNGKFDMVQLDEDNDATTFNSSSANVDLDTNETVVWAGLYWMAGFTDFGKTSITAPTNPELRDRVKLKAPGGEYVEIVGAATDLEGRLYRGFADVTSMINTSGEYWVADVQAAQGRRMVGSWTLVVVTNDPDLPARTLTVSAPFERVDERKRFSITDFAGSYPSDANMEFGYVAWDGDAGSTDFIFINGNQLLPDAPDPTLPSHAWDIGNSTISWYGNNVDSRTPAHKNNFGFDADIFDGSDYIFGSTDIDVELVTSGDKLFTGIFTFQTDLSTPDINSIKNRSRVDLNDYEIIGDATGLGCSSVPTSPNPFWLLLGLLGFARRRRG